MLGTYIGNYRLVTELGGGAMGDVYFAEHAVMGRRAAIKIIREELSRDKAIIDRFVNEARAVNAIQHPNIVQITDFGQLGSLYYLIMELLEGETLEARLEREPRLKEEMALRIAGQVCDALSAAHSVGIVHRDLKPENIFLVNSRAGSELVKVLDFGVAKLTQYTGRPDVTTPGMLLGTPHYMSPEQCRAMPDLDHRSDVYSLGVVLYRMLAGRLPLDSEELLQLLFAHVNQVPPELRSVAPDVSEPTAAAVMRALKKDPAERFPDMAAFRAALFGLSDAEAPTGLLAAPPPQAAPSPGSPGAKPTAAQTHARTLAAAKPQAAPAARPQQPAVVAKPQPAPEPVAAKPQPAAAAAAKPAPQPQMPARPAAQPMAQPVAKPQPAAAPAPPARAAAPETARAQSASSEGDTATAVATRKLPLGGRGAAPAPQTAAQRANAATAAAPAPAQRAHAATAAAPAPQTAAQRANAATAAAPAPQTAAQRANAATAAAPARTAAAPTAVEALAPTDPPAAAAPAEDPVDEVADAKQTQRAANRLAKIVLERLHSGRLKLPPLSDAALRCVEQLREVNVSAPRLAETLSRDPLMASQIIRYANSVMVGGGARVRTLELAVSRLGAVQLRALLMELSARTLFESRNPAIRQAFQLLWDHALAVAAVAQQIANKTPGAKTDMAYLAGLLHDIGKPVIAAVLLEAERQAVNKAEQWINATNWLEIVADCHREVGVAVARTWLLPDEVMHAIARSNRFTPEGKTATANLVCFANALVKDAGVYAGPIDKDEVKTLIRQGVELYAFNDEQLAQIRAPIKKKR